ncbi:MAG: FAD-dependent oxidoreductase [Deferribacterales bacterium]
MSSKIVIIGGVAAGATAAAKARRTSEDVSITMAEKGRYISFANCGLPYYTGGTIASRNSILLHTKKTFGDRFNAEVMTNTEALSIDPVKKTVLFATEKGQVETPYDKLLIATGAKTFIPKIEGIDTVPYFTMRTVDDADGVKEWIETKKPKSALIIGGGFIGIETAEAMLHCGIKPTVVEALDEIMPNLPRIIAVNLREKMVSDGCEVIIRKYVKKLTQTNRIHAELSDGTVIDTDLVILCTGVRPATGLAAAAGVTVGERGGILTNERMETNIKDIYAAGDVVEKTNLITGKKVLMPLAGPANREGRAAGCNMAGGDMIFKGVIGSSVVGFNGFVSAQTGLTYEQALAAGFDADYVYTEDVNTSSYYPGHGYIFMMTVFDKKTGRLLGLSACGADGTEKRADEAAVAIYAGLSVYDLEHLEFCYAPPFASAKDNLNIAGFVASNNLRHTGFTVTPEFIYEKIKKGEKLQLLDVRSAPEHKAYAIEGSKHIFVNDVRNNTDKIDRTQPVYVYCAVGFRGYLAVRSLRNLGFEAYNITGGIEAYFRVKKIS